MAGVFSHRMNFSQKMASLVTVCIFLSTTLFPAPLFAQTQMILPAPGTMVGLTPGYTPSLIRGIKLFPDNPFQFDFIIDSGDSKVQGEDLKMEANRLVKYFLAALTVPGDELWVNLSPYEKDRLISKKFGETDMGRDLLAQDYILKQLTASLTYPEKEIGKSFWSRVYKRAQEEFGTTEIPMNTFNKIWVVPAEALVYEYEQGAIVANSRLKVMLEEDYLALDNYKSSAVDSLEKVDAVSGIQSAIVKDILIPEIEKEVNEGKSFASLRQIYNSVLLATWYKENLKNTLLDQVYVNQNKTAGIDIADKDSSQKIYNQYIQAFEKGVYDYIKEDFDATNDKLIPRKYFSGGSNMNIELSRKGSSPFRLEPYSSAASPMNFTGLSSVMVVTSVAQLMEEQKKSNDHSGNASSAASSGTQELTQGIKMKLGKKVNQLFGRAKKNDPVTKIHIDVRGKSKDLLLKLQAIVPRIARFVSGMTLSNQVEEREGWSDYIASLERRGVSIVSDMDREISKELPTDRAVKKQVEFRIDGSYGLPEGLSPQDKKTAGNLAQFVRDQQQLGRVVIAEPEIITRRVPSLRGAISVHRKVLEEVIIEFQNKGVYLPGVVLKLTVPSQGLISHWTTQSELLGQETIKLLKEVIPQKLGGIVLTVKGEVTEQALRNLNAIAEAAQKQHFPLGIIASFEVKKPGSGTKDETSQLTPEEVFVFDTARIQAASLGVLDAFDDMVNTIGHKALVQHIDTYADLVEQNVTSIDQLHRWVFGFRPPEISENRVALSTNEIVTRLNALTEAAKKERLIITPEQLSFYLGRSNEGLLAWDGKQPHPEDVFLFLEARIQAQRLRVLDAFDTMIKTLGLRRFVGNIDAYNSLVQESLGARQFLQPEVIVHFNPSASQATASSAAVGGIDLNPELIDMDIKRNGQGMPLPAQLQPVFNMDIEGLLPVIINVTPIQSLPLYLGLADETDNNIDYSFDRNIPADRKARLELNEAVEQLSYLN